jgi:hypothetical protein
LTNCPGIINRTKNLFTVLNLEKWTSNSVNSNTLQLHITFFITNEIIETGVKTLPEYITYDFKL